MARGWRVVGLLRGRRRRVVLLVWQLRHVVPASETYRLLQITRCVVLVRLELDADLELVVRVLEGELL